MAQKPKELPPTEVLINALYYNPGTGSFLWKRREERGPAWNARFADRTAGYTYTNTIQNHYNGIVIGIKYGNQNHLYQAHRIAWKIMTGLEPPDQIDHINGNAMDNRWSNIRDGYGSINSTNRKKYSNNSTGVTGVGKKGSKWRARVRINGKLHSLGTYSKIEDAESAVVEFRKKSGFSETHGVR